VQRQRQLVGKLNKTIVEQIILSGMLPVMGGMGAKYRNGKRMAINAVVEKTCEEEGVGLTDLSGYITRILLVMCQSFLSPGRHPRLRNQAILNGSHEFTVTSNNPLLSCLPFYILARRTTLTFGQIEASRDVR